MIDIYDKLFILCDNEANLLHSIIVNLLHVENDLFANEI